MGKLITQDIKYLKNKYSLVNFIETGTWLGTGIEAALSFGFSKIVSIEINKSFTQKAISKFKDCEQVKILFGTSKEMLPQAIKIVGNEPTLFWLDAHLPGIKDIEINLKLPLEDELDIILKTRCGKDVLIIDDLRLYEIGCFENGNCINYIPGHLHNIINKLKAIKCSIIKDYRQEGFMLGLPR